MNTSGAMMDRRSLATTSSTQWSPSTAPQTPARISPHSVTGTRRPAHPMCRWTWPTTSRPGPRSEEHTSELQSQMRTSYAVYCLNKKNQHTKWNLEQQTQNPNQTKTEKNHV